MIDISRFQSFGFLRDIIFYFLVSGLKNGQFIRELNLGRNAIVINNSENTPKTISLSDTITIHFAQVTVQYLTLGNNFRMEIIMIEKEKNHVEKDKLVFISIKIINCKVASFEYELVEFLRMIIVSKSCIPFILS